MSYKFIIDSKVKGIPCKVGVTWVSYTRPDKLTWSSDIDYRGGWVAEWELLDRKGYKATWLGKKMTDDDYSRIDEEVSMWCSESMGR